MKKLITYSVFGNNPVFNVGAIKNVELAQEIYPDWISRFYLFSESSHLEKELLKFPNVEVFKTQKSGGFYSTIWRFLPLEDNTVDFFISRDVDSRLSTREKRAVDEWIESGKTFHIMKDHPYHYTPEYPILAGMFGSKGGVIPNIRDYIGCIIKNFSEEKGVDQKVLYHIYHDYAINDNLTHNHEGFPTERNFEIDKIYFVGQVFDENNNFGGNWQHDLQKLGIRVDI